MLPLVPIKIYIAADVAGGGDGYVAVAVAVAAGGGAAAADSAADYDIGRC